MSEASSPGCRVVREHGGGWTRLPRALGIHLAEYLGLAAQLDVAELNRRSLSLAHVDSYSQLLVTSAETDLDVVQAAMPSGRWVIDGFGRAQLSQTARDWHQLDDETEFFLLRITETGALRYPGSHLGLVITKGRSQASPPREEHGHESAPVLTARANARWPPAVLG